MNRPPTDHQPITDLAVDVVALLVLCIWVGIIINVALIVAAAHT